jgi:hypothetical protein
MYNEFMNFNVFIEREKPYIESGRMQKEFDAKLLDDEIKKLLNELKISYATIKGNKENVSAISKEIIRTLNMRFIE